MSADSQPATVADSRELPSGAYLERLADGNYRIRQTESSRTQYVYLSPMDLADMLGEIEWLDA